MGGTNFSSYMAIKNRLLDMFKMEKFENNKLPSEAELAQMMDISLATLREALMMLALEGYITKRHGAGNYVHPSTLNFENRIIFSECLQRNGYEVRQEIVSQQTNPMGEEIGKLLGLPASAPAIFCTNVHYADGQPAVLSVSTLPKSMLVDPTLERIQSADFLYLHEMIWKYCRRNLAHSLNEYNPLGLPEEVATLFKLPQGTPIITNSQVFYDTFDTPVIYIHSYFYPGLYKVRVLQNWALGQTV